MNFDFVFDLWPSLDLGHCFVPTVRASLGGNNLAAVRTVKHIVCTSSYYG